MLNDIKPFPNERTYAKATLPYYPTDWKPPKEFPNLSCAKVLAIDTETKDKQLKESGPGWGRRGGGHIIGISVATEDAAWYFPMRHEIQTELNIDPDKVLTWANDVLSTDIPKIFANASYDVGWLNWEGVKIGGKYKDIIVAEKLIDSSQFSYSLEAIAKKYLGEGKVTDEVYSWCSQAYGGKPDNLQRGNLYRTPPSLVGPYAEADARLPFDIFKQQHRIMNKHNLLQVFDLETRLIPILIAMRMKGVRISVPAAMSAIEGLEAENKRWTQKLNEIAGFHVNPNSPHHLEKLFLKAGVQIQRTANDNPSFTASWLEGEIHPAAHMIREIRKNTKIISTFVQGAIIDKNINGRVHGQFHQMGAKTGRFSSSQPNLQNIPARDRKLGPLMRKMFIPEPGFKWIKLDYSSVEFRVFAHFSQDPTLIKAYNENPLVDFHQVVEDMVKGDLPRVVYKTLSFSRMFGGGIKTIAKQMNLNFSVEEQRRIIRQFGYKVLSNPADQAARLIMNLYDKEFPAVNDGLMKAAQLAEDTGEMRTILGRRVLYNEFEPAIMGGSKVKALPYDLAYRKWGPNLRRSRTYKALNVFTQGTSADIMKQAMVNAWEEGLFKEDKLGPPALTVHDELDFSAHPDQKEYFLELQQIMQDAIKLDVPLIVEADLGENWGSVKKDFDLSTWSFKK